MGLVFYRYRTILSFIIPEKMTKVPAFFLFSRSEKMDQWCKMTSVSLYILTRESEIQ